MNGKKTIDELAAVIGGTAASGLLLGMALSFLSAGHLDAAAGLLLLGLGLSVYTLVRFLALLASERL